MSFLIRVANEGSDGAAHVLRVGIVDVNKRDEKKSACVWTWAVRAQEAQDYLKGLVRAMMKYWAGSADGDGKYINFTYSKLGEAGQAIKAGEWAKVVDVLGKSDFNAKPNYDRKLAVDEAIEKYWRLPTEKEIEGIYTALYQLVFDGKMEKFETEEEREKREAKEAKSKKGKGAKK